MFVHFCLGDKEKKNKTKNQQFCSFFIAQDQSCAKKAHPITFLRWKGTVKNAWRFSGGQLLTSDTAWSELRFMRHLFCCSCPIVALLVVRSPFMVWAPSGYGRAAIVCFRDVPGPLSHMGPLPLAEGLQRPYGQYRSILYTYGRWAGCPGNKRQKGGWTSHRSCPSTASSSSC